MGSADPNLRIYALQHRLNGNLIATAHQILTLSRGLRQTKIVLEVPQQNTVTSV